MSERIVAGIDCGTNSIRLLVARATADGLRELHRETQIIRLGEGIDSSGAFTSAALDRCEQQLRHYVDVMKRLKVERVRMVATSATRDASNREVFFSMTSSLLGEVSPGAVAEVISGDEEARLSFAGAVGELDPAGAPFLVVDLGGGSTESVLGDANGVTAAFSADMGCVRLTERFLHSDPPTADEIARAEDAVRRKFAETLTHVDVKMANSCVGVAGTFTTLAALAMDLPEYDSSEIHLSNIACDAMESVCRDLLSRSAAQRLKLGPMHPGRADVVGGGAVVALGLIELLRQHTSLTSLTVSEHDILDGVVMSLTA